MSTKVKVGIAGVIVAALVALIVLDQGTAPSPGTASTDTTGNLPIKSPDGSRPGRDQEELDFFKEVEKNLGPKKPPTATKTPIKGAPDLEPGRDNKPVTAPVAPPAPVPAPAAPSEEYVIKQGDNLEAIAMAKYGERKGVAWIMKANPGLKPTALGVGRKILLPPKPEKPEEAAKADAPAALESANGQKVYVVQVGDTLGAISAKVYNTSRYQDKIAEANSISDPNSLHVGMKLVMPDLPRKESSNEKAMAGTGTVQTGAAPAPAKGKLYQVQQGDSLWKIAEKYAGDKGVHAMVKQIVEANGDVLKDGAKSLVRIGWSLVIPE